MSQSKITEEKYIKLISPELESIVQKITAYDKMYDLIRMVDPVMKRVLVLENGVWRTEAGFCYDVYEENHVCSNCVSIRALNTQTTSIKTQFLKDQLHMVTAVPVVIEGRSVVLELFKDLNNSTDFIQDQLKEMQNLIRKTNDLLVTDVLTGIYNRRFIDERLPVDFALNQTHGEAAQLLMIDIDHFKRVNDQYGHLMGDKVLKDVARLMKQAFSDTEMIARYGGEEFLVYHVMDVAQTLNKAETFRANVERHPFVYEDKIIHITVSIGVHTVDHESPTVAIERADQKLYKAKTTGRNKIVFED